MSCQQGNGSITTGSYTIYDTSLAVLALCATGNPEYYDEISTAAQFLIDVQDDEDTGYTIDNQYYGGWAYPSENWADLSNSQFAMLALHYAEDFDTGDTIVPTDLWEKAKTFVERCQNRWESNPDYSLDSDGGFIYLPAGTYWADGRSYGSMTSAGLWGFYVTGVGRADPRVEDAFGWLETNYRVEQNYPIGDTLLYYYLYSLARACVLWNEPTLAGHTWYEEMSQALLDRQEWDGHWAATHDTDEPDRIATCWAILALETKLIPEGASMEFIVESPVDLHVYDAEGRHTGINYETGEIEEQIPGSTYFPETETEPQRVRIENPIAGTYTIQLVAREAGEYTLTVAGVVEETVVTTQTFTGTVEAEEVHGASATVSAIAGPITTDVTEPAPLLQLQPVQFTWGEPAPGYSYEDWPLFEGWMHVLIENPGPDNAYNVTATITSCPENFTIVDPDVTVGDIDAGLSAWSTDTFTYNIDMREPVDPQKGFVWRITYDDQFYHRHTVEGRSTLVTFQVPVDIKPGSDPNSVNLGSSGVVPAAFLTTPDFDAGTIDPQTVMFGGYDFWGDIKLRGKKDGAPMASLEDVDDDGDLDLVVHVEVEHAATEPTDVECQLRAFTFDGLLVWGTDSVRIVPPR